MDGYITTTQFCEKYGLQTAVVLHHIYSGRIAAEKIKGKYAIPADTPKPADLRVKSGKYKGWREKYGKK